MILYLFNPEHDYALANNDPHFMAPASAVQFADECALFLQHIVPSDGYIFLPYRKQDRFYHISTQTFTDEPDEIDRIIPWGWDLLMQYQLATVVSGPLLLAMPIFTTHTLAHRHISIEGMDFLRIHCPQLNIPVSATLLRTPSEVAQYVHDNKDVVLKSPYSGNGRGNLYAHDGIYSATLERQTTGVIHKQGSILGEPLYDIVQDFAMEFLCQDQQTTFAGYSLFNTKHYGYNGNLLCSDSHIEQTLNQWISTEQLEIIKKALISFIQGRIAPEYSGYLGVDMFIYQDNGFKINPMVEINLRMTMGMAAHILYERHVHPEVTGELHLEYVPEKGELLRRANQLQQAHPLELKDGLWHSGFMALNPIDETTQYAFFVLLHA